MFGLGTPEIVIILLIFVVLFGSKKLPELGSGLGKAISSFKKGVADVEEVGESVKEKVPVVKELSEIKETVEQTKKMVTKL